MVVSIRINKILQIIPDKIGIYQYFDINQKLLYIGKAKNLKKRVYSYFKKTHEYARTRALVAQIHDIKYIVLESEMDALLLENNLIKKYQPKYNVMLKDGKTYPWICIKKEPFPRVFQTRRVINDGSDYYGPYASVRIVKTLLDFFCQLYPIRNCTLNLSRQNIKSGKFKVCLEYHMKNCLGPCVGKQQNQDYLLGIAHIKKILSGDINEVITHLKLLMQKYSNSLEYEKAQSIKDKIVLLANYQAKSTIVNASINDIDVFSIVSNQDSAFVNFLKIKSGAIIQAHTLEIKKKLKESENELIQLAIIDIRQRFNSNSKEICCSHHLESNWKDLRVTTPKIGDKKKLVDLSLRNAKYMLLDKQKQKANNLSRRDNNRVLYQLKKDLNLKCLPSHIECFDNSNMQGSNAVGACVVFKNGRPSKKEYRNFNIKTVVGPDDYASMEEVIYRRYKRVLKENKELPHLIVIDGGKGQLSSAIKALKKLYINKKISIIGIAKRLEEIYFPKDNIPLYLDKRSESLKLIQQLRNEAHRFSIAHHRNKRSTNALGVSFDKIEGIGPKTIELLIAHFGSVKRVKNATKKELINIVGKNKAFKILKN